MVVKTVPPLPKFTRSEATILKQLNVSLKTAEVTDKSTEILGAIKRIDASPEGMKTTWARLDATAEKLKTAHRSVVSRLFGKKPILTASIVTELQAQIRTEFPVADFIPKPPKEGDDIDLLLESVLIGPSKYRFYQLESAERLLADSDEIQGKISRSLVTGLRGVANFRDASSVGGLPREGGSEYSMEEVLKLVNLTRSMKKQPAYVYDSAEIKALGKFKPLGLKAYDLLIKKDLCYGGHETSLKDWGALSADKANPVNLILTALKEDVAKIKEQGAEVELEKAILDFITALNTKITATVELAMDFEAMRHQAPQEVEALEEKAKEVEIKQENKEVSEDKKSDTASASIKSPKDLFADIAKEAIRAKPLRKTIVRRPTLTQADAAVTKVIVRYSGIKVDDESDEEEGSSQARPLSFTGSPEPSDPTELLLPSEMQAAAVGGSTYTLPVGFECFEGEYVYRGNALSPENKAARDALAMDMTKPGRTVLNRDFDLYSDGMYRQFIDRSYMLVGDRVFSSDLQWELVAEPDASAELKTSVEPEASAEPEISTEPKLSAALKTSAASNAKIEYKITPVADGQIIMLLPGITITTPVRIIK